MVLCSAKKKSFLQKKEEKKNRRGKKVEVSCSSVTASSNISNTHKNTQIQVQHPVVSQCVSLGLSGPL